jgi:hypothetical protein
MVILLALSSMSVYLLSALALQAAARSTSAKQKVQQHAATCHVCVLAQRLGTAGSTSAKQVGSHAAQVHRELVQQHAATCERYVADVK